MTIPSWPSGLPSTSENGEIAMVEGFQMTQPEGRLRTSTDTGPGKVRLMNSAAVMPVTMEMFCTSNDLARFNRFWVETLGRGVKVFTFPDPTTFGDDFVLGDEDGAPLGDEDGVLLGGSDWWLARFGSAPTKPARSGSLYQIRFELLVLP